MGAPVTLAPASPWLLGEARFALTLARPSWFGRGRDGIVLAAARRTPQPCRSIHEPF